MHPVSNRRDVEQVAAVLGKQRIDQQHVGAQRDEMVRHVAADEAEATGHHHATATIEIAIVGVHGAGCRGAGLREDCGFEISRHGVSADSIRTPATASIRLRGVPRT